MVVGRQKLFEDDGGWRTMVAEKMLEDNGGWRVFTYFFIPVQRRKQKRGMCDCTVLAVGVLRPIFVVERWGGLL